MSEADGSETWQLYAREFDDLSPIFVREVEGVLVWMIAGNLLIDELRIDLNAEGLSISEHWESQLPYQAGPRAKVPRMEDFGLRQSHLPDLIPIVTYRLSIFAVILALSVSNLHFHILGAIVAAGTILHACLKVFPGRLGQWMFLVGLLLAGSVIGWNVDGNLFMVGMKGALPILLAYSTILAGGALVGYDLIIFLPMTLQLAPLGIIGSLLAAILRRFI
ncbi:hypothetical protein EPO15_14065 [bacterium]|nr:MAG: hypothetical protein EPO15_14065 [bacterium]